MYQRYHVEAGPAPEIVPFPNQTRVKVSKPGLAWHLITQMIRYRGNRAVALSRPCLYGVFSGPVGGFAPRDHLCMGCQRCTTEYPEMVRVYPNPERRRLGDSYFTPALVETTYYEARTGKIPVRGAGYRGPFGGEGWDGMWTDMSEIVRPTRDGIHGREFISTSVDLGEKPPFLIFDERGRPAGAMPVAITLPVPFLLDAPPASLPSSALVKILAAAAAAGETLVILPARTVLQSGLHGPHIVPRIGTRDADVLRELHFAPRMIELDGWSEALYGEARACFPESIICLRLEFAGGETLSHYLHDGIRVFHLVADYHGRGAGGRFVLDLIREAHKSFVDAGCRDEVTLLGSGGIIAGEHVPKAIICGLDAIALDTPVLAALQADFLGDCAGRSTSRFRLPKELTEDWGARRVTNLLASWRDQLLEILGAMGLREVRRLRGEVGRAMFQKDLEREAFSGIDGYGE